MVSLPEVNLTFSKQDKKMLVGGLVLLLLAVIFFLTLPVLVDKKAIENQIKEAFKTATGLELEIQDGMDVSLFPTPHVKIKNLYVSNVPGATTSFLLSIHSMGVKIRSASLLSSHPVVDTIAIDDAVLELERMKNGHMNWQELLLAAGNNAASNSNMAAAAERVDHSNPFNSLGIVLAGLPKISAVTIKNTEVHFTDSQLGLVTEYTDINANFSNSSGSSKSILDATVTFEGLAFRLKTELGDLGTALAQKKTSGKISLESEHTTLDYNGEIGFDKTLMLKGNINFDSKNLISWIRVLNGFSSRNLTSTKKMLPLTLSGDVTTDDKKIVFPSIKVGGGIFGGTLNASLKFPLLWDIKGTLDTLDFNALLESGVFEGEKTDTLKKASGADTNDTTPATLRNMMVRKSLWSYANIAVDIRAARVDFNQSHLTNGHIAFDMTDGDMTITQLSALFPGNSKVLFTGLGKEGYQGFMLDGQLDASGENFVEITSVFRPGDQPPLLPVDFKRFRIKTNLVLSSKELRLTELTSRVEGMAFVGGIIVSFVESPIKIQSAIRIGGVDLDRFLTLWGVNKFKETLTTENVGGAKVEEPVITQWLHNLGMEIDARVSLEQFNFDGKQVEKLKFRTAAVKNKLSVMEIELSFGESSINGTLILDVSKPQPFLDVDFTADTFDATPYLGESSFIYDKEKENAPKSTGVRNWSHKGMDFQWLANLNSVYHFKAGMLKSGKLELLGFEAKGSIEDKSLNVTSISSQLKGSQFSGKGVLKGGKIPSVFMTGDITGLDVADLVEFMPVLGGLSGKFNTHLKLISSGIDVYTMVYNLEGSVTLAARDVTIEGFNVPAIVSAVAYVRTVADILDAIKRAYPGGNTTFTSVDGEWTIANGVIKIPSIKMVSEFADGSFSGQLDVMNWKIGARMQLQLSYLDRADPPKVVMNFTGNLDGVQMELDTAHLEQYVAKKTSEKLLQHPDSN